MLALLSLLFGTPHSKRITSLVGEPELRILYNIIIINIINNIIIIYCMFQIYSIVI